MLFKKKYLENCTIKCIERNIMYKYDDRHDKNIAICEYKFKFTDRESNRTLYKYDENDNYIYDIDQVFSAVLNTRDGSFEIIESN